MKRSLLFIIFSLAIPTLSHAQLSCPDYALHRAVEEGYPDVLQISVGLYANTGLCDINGKNPNGDTPLHLAVFIGNLEMVRILLDNGASVFVKNAFGEQPIDWPELTGNDEISFLLKESAKKASQANLLSPPVSAQDKAELFVQALEVDTQALEASAQALEMAALALDAWSQAGGPCAEDYEDCNGQAKYYREIVIDAREGVQAMRDFLQNVQNDPTLLTDDVFLSLSPSTKEQESRKEVNTAKGNEASSKDGADKARLVTQSGTNARMWTLAADAHDRASEAWAEAVAAWTLSAEAWKRLGEYDSASKEKEDTTGPFGITMGDSINKIIENSGCIERARQQDGKTRHNCTKLDIPNPHSLFSEYEMHSTEETGIFMIAAKEALYKYDRNVPDGLNQLRSAFGFSENNSPQDGISSEGFTTEIANQLSKKYGKWDKYEDELVFSTCDFHQLNMGRYSRNLSNISCYDRFVYTWDRSTSRDSNVLKIELYTDEHVRQANLIFWFTNTDLAEQTLYERILKQEQERIKQEQERNRKDEQTF